MRNGIVLILATLLNEEKALVFQDVTLSILTIRYTPKYPN